eukprot:CAMPEP_0174848470 /NCGR_PEP_ID=MMETSP1114-20130205/13543_1 /TAXON_ID=312471 /ORGANISM="Neobodo designis, Strain CCAP 1951/1" /LENGTH=608 /DNA_ID=CAMNT_0016082773 /DNA_START=46 /DNA_END=1872 /DNA_ORIENTATION=-
MSMASGAMRSEASRAVTYGGNASDRMHERELGLSRRPGALETASDTSSVRERKFANLLGGDDSGSERDVSPTGRSVGHRLYYTGTGRERQKQERLRDERERLLMSEMAQMTQRPNITARARSKMSKGQYFADHASMWSEQRDQRLRKAAQEVAKERFADVRDKPALNPRSEALVKAHGEYKGPVRHWKEHFEKFSARRVRDEARDAAAFTPNINANAVRVDVERTISDRLYQDSSSRRERLSQLAHEQQARELIDPGTGRPLFQPHALRRGSPTPQRDPEELSMQLHDESYEAARRREIAAQSHPDSQHSFKPTINPASEELAKRARKPLYVPRAQRAEEERQRKERIQRARSADASPRVAPQTRVSVDEFLRRAQRNEMTRAQKLAAIRAQQDDRELGECVFHPRISRRSEDIFYASNVSGTPMRSPLEPQSPVAESARSPHPHHQQQQQQYQQPPASGGQSPSNPSTARKPASPARGSPKMRAGRESTAEAFAAVMAASGVGTGGQSPSGGAAARRSPRSGAAAGDYASQRSPMPKRGGSAAGAAASASMAAPIDESPVPVSMPRQSAPRAASQPQGGMGDVDQYIQQFESQMYSVLEEWRKLEEV